MCKIFLLMLALSVALCAAAFADTEGFTFALNGAGDGYVVTGYTGSASSVKVPDWYNQKPVTEIGDSAFEGCASFTEICKQVVPEWEEVSPNHFVACHHKLHRVSEKEQQG